MPRLAIGTSGWTYPAWRSDFYAGVPQRRWLAHCAQHFSGIEVNATFYRRLRPETIARWREETPAGFVFAVKGHRFVTHVRRLADVEEPVRRMRDELAPLGDRLDAVLWQLPPSLTKNLVLIKEFRGVLAAWSEVRHVIEFRHRSWFDEETLATLERLYLATCISDAPRWPMWEAVACRFAYVRLHGHERLYASAYGEEGLRPWADRAARWLAEGSDVRVYLDNDAEGAAPCDATLLIRMLRGARGIEAR